MRRLPVYILIDNSGSMRGEPIQAVQSGLYTLISSLRQDPYALETAYISIITFGVTSQQLIPLTELIYFQPPALTAEGVGTTLGGALRLLADRINSEVNKTTHDVKGDWKPIIFIMTDGEPTDNFEDGIKALKALKTGMVVACAAGDDVNTLLLREITENVVELKKLSAESAKSFFQWVSASIGTSSQKIDAGKEINDFSELPKLPDGVNKVTDFKKGKQPDGPFNTFDRERALNKDRYGNPEGNEFDLAKNNAFKGYQIAVLHLYTGEGFDFRFPEKALKEKGFEIVRWKNKPPSLKEFQNVLKNSCQLWLISSDHQKLTQEYIETIKDFFFSGKGIYLWGDNDPYTAEINPVSEQFFGVEMTGDEFGDQVLGKKSGSVKNGFIDHEITTGLDFLYEGITIAHFPDTNGLETLMYSSSGNSILVYYDKNNRRALLDGGFTRLYHKWDSAGTARYVKNAAAWLVNYGFNKQH